MSVVVKAGNLGMNDEMGLLLAYFGIKMGICVPSSCSKEVISTDLTEILSQYRYFFFLLNKFCFMKEPLSNIS